MDYLTIVLQDTVVNAGLDYTESDQQGLGDLYTTYVLTSPSVSSSNYTTFTRRDGGAYLPVSKSGANIYHAIPYHTVPYRTIPYHTIPYTLPYPTTP